MEWLHRSDYCRSRQIDWSTEYAWVGGLHRRLEVAHTHLCGSRAFWLVAYLVRRTNRLLHSAHRSPAIGLAETDRPLTPAPEHLVDLMLRWAPQG